MGLINYEYLSNYPTGNYSSIYLNKVDQNQINFKSYSNYTDALKSVQDGTNWGFILINENFTDAVKKKLTQFDKDPRIVNDSLIHLNMDQTNQQISFIIENVLLNSSEMFLKEILSSFGLDPTLIDPPVRIEKIIYGNRNPEFRNFVAPGIMMSIIYFLAIGLTSLIFVVEKKEGLFERIWLTGVKTIEMIIAHLIMKTFIQFIQIILMISFAKWIFHIEFNGSIILTFLLIYLQGICGMSYGFLISSICSTEVQVMEVAMGSVFPMMLASGVIWPIEGMPTFLQWISHLTPLTNPIQSIRSILGRGWSIDHFQVYFGFIISFLWSIIYLFIAILLFALRR